MASRGMQLGGDLDNLAYAAHDEFDAVLKKYCATKNCKPEAAFRWALQRAMTEADRQFIQSKFDELYKSGASLI